MSVFRNFIFVCRAVAGLMGKDVRTSIGLIYVWTAVWRPVTARLPALARMLIISGSVAGLVAHLNSSWMHITALNGIEKMVAVVRSYFVAPVTVLYAVLFGGMRVIALMAIPPILIILIHTLLRGAKAFWRGLWYAPLIPLPADDFTKYKLVLVQLSDCHLTDSGAPYEIRQRPELWPAAPLESSQLANTTTRLLRAAQHFEPEIVAFTGDITDTGSLDEWWRFESLITFMSREIAVALLPGNHDIELNLPENPDLDGAGRRIRAQRFSEVMSRCERGAWTPVSVGEPFPRWMQTRSGATVVLLDSVQYGSEFILSNAVGSFGTTQLGSLESLLAGVSGPVLVLCHHHVGYANDKAHHLLDPLIIAGDGRGLLELLCGYSKRSPVNAVLLVHGHRHVYFYGEYRSGRGGLVQVYGHPSSTLGQDRDGYGLDGIPRLAKIWLSREGGWGVETVTLRD